MEIKEDDLVMCTVKRIEGTTIFLDVEGDGEGSMVLSEIAAGRIRNLREYVAPNKKIVCKVLKIINGHPQLSFRRVTAKEKEEIRERYTKERTLTSIFKAVLENYEEILLKIKSKEDLWKLYDEAKENPSILEVYLSKENAKKISGLLSEKKEKEKESKKIFVLKSFSEKGLEDIKEILDLKQEVDIHYLGSSQFSISSKGKEFKEINSKIDDALATIEKKAKDKKAIFETKEK
jgi:translation initiation factor 2 alpha subunit (eIF-2alpha)